MEGKILLVTGKEAASSVKKHARGRVHVCGVDVAALLSINAIARELSAIELRGFSMVIVPGLVSGDTSRLSKKLGVPVYKGTKQASDIPVLLDSLPGLRLSTTLPADALIESRARDSAQRKVREAYDGREGFLLAIGSRHPVYLGGGNPMHVVAEIADAPRLSLDELKAKARHYVESGASIVDIGMVAGEDNSALVPEIISSVKSTVKAPVSIDSMNEKEIVAAVDAGAELVLSIGVGNSGVVGKIDVPFVVVPTSKAGRLPYSAEQRVRALRKSVKAFRGRDFILDPVLSPLNHGFVESLKALSLLRSTYPKTPLLMGAGNVTELLDADSLGVNALLAGIASEIGVELLFTVEASAKTRGSVAELSTSAKMMYLAKINRKSPKDLGLHLLKLKDKKAQHLVEDPKAREIEYLMAKNRPSVLESECYRISLVGHGINVLKYEGGTPGNGYRGNSAEVLCKTLCSKEKISPEHAAYLGKELARAEIALKLGKNYVQDEELF